MHGPWPVSSQCVHDKPLELVPGGPGGEADSLALLRPKGTPQLLARLANRTRALKLGGPGPTRPLCALLELPGSTDTACAIVGRPPGPTDNKSLLELGW